MAFVLSASESMNEIQGSRNGQGRFFKSNDQVGHEPKRVTHFFGKSPVTTMRSPQPSGPPLGVVAQQRMAPPKLTG